MLRRIAPPHAILAGYCGGLCLALAITPPGWALLLAAAGVVALLAAGLRRAGAAAGPAWLAVVPAALTALFLVAGLAMGEQRLGAIGESRLAGYVGQTVALQAVVTDLPAIDDDQVTLAVDVAAVDVAAVGSARLADPEPAHLSLRLDEDRRYELDPTGPLAEGAVVTLASAGVEPLPEADPGEFDYGRYLERRGEHVTLEGEFADLRVVGRRGGLQGMVDRLRRASRTHLAAGVRSPVREVLRGMVLGDDEGVDEQLIDDFRRSGLLHIMAVSGENVVLLCGMWGFALALFGIPRLARTSLLLPIVATYVLLTGASPSIVRAGVAGIIGLLAILASRPSDGWVLWLAPAAWLLTANPNTLLDASFQLSFGAVVGLLLLARPLTRLFAFLPGPIAEQVGVTTAASISTAPISMLTFGSASLVSVPANVAGGFVLGPIMFLGMLSLLAGFVSSWLSTPLNVVAGLFIGFLLRVARVFGRLSWAVVEWRGVSLGLLIALIVIAEGVTLAVLAARGGVGPLTYLRDRRRLERLGIITAVMMAVALVLAPAPVRPPETPTLTFLDVGEGAAALLQGRDMPTVLIDAGPGFLMDDLDRHGVSEIDLLVVSHGHADHIGGLDDVLGRLKVRTALLPDPPEPSAALDALAAELEAGGTEVRRVTTALDLGGDGWGLRVVPTSSPEGEGGNQGENDAALIALVTIAGQRALLPGDAEGDVLGALDLPSCTVVELPHHGSRGGLDEALVDELAPRLTVVSVGPNTYGHPTAEMLALVAAAGVPCARTDEHGDVAVWAADDGLRVAAEHGAGDGGG